MDTEEELTWLEALEQYHSNNPALKEAYDQIKTIRTLSGYKQDTSRDYITVSWEQKYFSLLDETDYDAENPAVTEAWSKYEMLKSLLQVDAK